MQPLRPNTSISHTTAVSLWQAGRKTCELITCTENISPRKAQSRPLSCRASLLLACAVVVATRDFDYCLGKYHEEKLPANKRKTQWHSRLTSSSWAHGTPHLQNARSKRHQGELDASMFALLVHHHCACVQTYTYEAKFTKIVQEELLQPVLRNIETDTKSGNRNDSGLYEIAYALSSRFMRVQVQKRS